MDMEMNDDLGATIDRLAAAASLLEQTVERLGEKIAAAELKLAATNEKLAELEAHAATAATAAPRADAGARKTLPSAMATLLAKQGVVVDGPASIEAGSIDAALSSLSLEQRIAVKAQLMRAGLLS
jgi:hypothetical protein